MKRTAWGMWGIPLLVAACPGKGGVGADAGSDAGVVPDEGVFETAAPADEAGPTDTGGTDDAVGPDAREALVPPNDPALGDIGADIADEAPADPGLDHGETPEPDLSPDGIGPLCFPDKTKPGLKGPNYDQFHPVVASHCLGTNHQDIHDVELVVFLGDSVTVGTPSLEHLLPIDNAHFWRNQLAEWLTDRYDLSQGNGLDWNLWKMYDPFSGKGGQVVAGDFRNCAKWGARTDDFLEGGRQIPECFPEGGSDRRTLVVFTMGGNDISKITEDGGNATPEEVAAGYPHEWDLAYRTIAYLEEAVAWLKDPARFPNGSWVIFASPYEFTDGTGKTDACSPQFVLDIPGIGPVDLSQFDLSLAALAGMKEWEKPEVLEDIVIWMLEQYMRIAVQYQADMIFLLEHFCGHGYVATGPEADPENRCYEGPDAELYFDVTCIHPSAAGHTAIYQMFRAVVEE